MGDKVTENDAKEIIKSKEASNPENFNTETVKSDNDVVSTKDDVQTGVIEKKDVHEAAEVRIDRSKGELGSMMEASTGESKIHGANDQYWKNVPIENTPAGGLFYPEGVELTIRSAEVAEIRHWSTIDENDFLDMDAKMNFIIEKCVRFKGPDGGWLSWKDLLEIDRFYIIFLIHELTFPNGENKMKINFGCNIQCKGDGTYREKVHLKANMLNLLIIPDDIMTYYDPNKRCFSKTSVKLNEDLEFILPTVGVSQKIKGLVKDARDNGSYIDPSFVKVAPYLIKEWRDIDDKYLERLRINTYKWNKNKLLFITGFSDKLEKAVNLTVKKQCPRCGVILEAPLFFRGGFTIKNLFIVSTGLDDLV